MPKVSRITAPLNVTITKGMLLQLHLDEEEQNAIGDFKSKSMATSNLAKSQATRQYSADTDACNTSDRCALSQEQNKAPKRLCPWSVSLCTAKRRFRRYDTIYKKCLVIACTFFVGNQNGKDSHFVIKTEPHDWRRMLVLENSKRRLA